MAISRILVMFLFLLIGTEGVLASGKKEPVKISFHIETDATDHPKMMFPHDIYGQKRFFRRLPEVAASDFVAFSPFPAKDQASYGAVFQLKGKARRRLAAVTSISIGKWLVCQAFGRIVDGVMVDDVVDDGAIVIWRGLTLEEIREIDKTIPRIGGEKP